MSPLARRRISTLNRFSFDFFALGCLTLMLGCASAAPATSKDPEVVNAAPASDKAPDAKPEKAAETPVTPDSKREQLAADAVKVLRDPKVTAEDAGSMATNEFGQPEYGIPEHPRKELAALTDPDVDYSQYGAIVAQAVGNDPMKRVLERKCGTKVNELLALDKNKANGTTQVLTLCKAGNESLNGRKPQQVRALSLLLSIGVLELLEERGAPSPSEKALARFLVQFDPAWHR